MASAIHVLLLTGTENEKDSYNFIETKSYNIMSTDGEKQSTPVKRKTQFSFVCAIDNKLNDCFYSHFVIHYFLYTFYIADSALKSFISGGLGGESRSFPILMSMLGLSFPLTHSTVFLTWILHLNISLRFPNISLQMIIIN